MTGIWTAPLLDFLEYLNVSQRIHYLQWSQGRDSLPSLDFSSGCRNSLVVHERHAHEVPHATSSKNSRFLLSQGHGKLASDFRPIIQNEQIQGRELKTFS